MAALDSDVLRFIRASVKSVWALESLLLMSREPARLWTVEQLTRDLRASQAIIATVLREFGHARLVEKTGETYRYAGREHGLDGLVQRLAASYARFPVGVTQAIVSAPTDKIQLFADAFRIKKD